MRKLTIPITLALFSLMLTACKKSDPSSFYFKATENNSSWNVTPTTGFKPLVTKDTLVIVAQRGEENIVLFIKNKGLGTYGVPDIDAYSYTTVGFDAVVSNYRLTNSAANKVTITNYDGNIVIGSFNLNLSKTYGDISLLNNISLSNGTFRAKISNKYLNPYR